MLLLAGALVVAAMVFRLWNWKPSHALIITSSILQVCGHVVALAGVCMSIVGFVKSRRGSRWAMAFLCAGHLALFAGLGEVLFMLLVCLIWG